METALVTGGAGFIGSNLSEHLLKEGFKVRIVDNLVSGSLRNIAHIRSQVEFIKGDVTDPALMRRAMKDVDYVLHHAAIASVQQSVENPLQSNKVNVEGTLNVLVAARDSGVKRVINASSSAVYGSSPKLPKTEDMPFEPLSPYACTKVAGELYCRQFSAIYGLDTVSLRYFNVFGPRQNPDSHYAAVIPIFIKQLLKGEKPVIFGNGMQSRDFVHVDDAVKANMLAIRAKRLGGQAINIARGEQINLRQLADMLNRLLGKNIQPEFAAPRAGDIMHSAADIARARQILSFQPSGSLNDDLKRTVSYFKQLAAVQ